MARFIIIFLAFLSLPCAAFPSLERDLEDIGPNDVDWNGYYTTSDGEKIYCPKAFREKRKQYAIKKQRERTTNWIITLAIILPSCVIGYVIYKEKKEKMRRKAEKEPRLKQLKEQQHAKAPKRTTFPTIPGMKNPLQEDLEREEEEKKEQQRLKSLEIIKGPPLHDLIMKIDDPMRETNKKILRKAVMMAEKQIHHSPAPPKPANPAPAPPDPQTEQGLNYERYIGYLMEQEGHIVFYRGAYAGEKDKGVDLVALKDTQTRLIQCKCFNDQLPVEQVEKYLRHIQYEWENASGSPIQDIPHIWELYCTSWLSNGAFQTCRTNNIKYTNHGTGVPPLVKAFHFEGEKRYMLPGQQFYDHIVSYIDGHNHKRFYKPEDAEKEGFSHLQLIDTYTVNLINQETIQNYALDHPFIPMKTINRPWLDF